MGLTFKEYLLHKLQENGMNPHHAEQVLPYVVTDEVMKGTMTGRWNDQIDGYPAAVATMMMQLARPIVYKWISDNLPHAWFRPIFAPGMEDCHTDAEYKAFVDKFWLEHPRVPKERPFDPRDDEALVAMTPSLDDPLHVRNLVKKNG